MYTTKYTATTSVNQTIYTNNLPKTISNNTARDSIILSPEQLAMRLS